MEEKTVKKKTNAFFKILIGLFSLLILLAVAVGVMWLLGVNPVQWTKEQAQNIPFLEERIAPDKTADVANGDLEQQLAEKNEEIAALNTQIDDLESMNNMQEQDILVLEKRLEEQEAEGTGNSEETAAEETGLPVDIMIPTYEEMDSEQAAAIMENLSNETAVLILQEVDEEVRGAILEAMEPATAANYTQQIIDKQEE